MEIVPRQRVARLDRDEIAGIPDHWDVRQRAQFCWVLLQLKGIDPARLFHCEYHPRRRCWLLVQDVNVSSPPPPRQAEELFYKELAAELRRTARAATAALAARSSHYALFGCDYELPSSPQEMTPAALAE
jgi:hypothetical protein